MRIPLSTITRHVIVTTFLVTLVTLVSASSTTRNPIRALSVLQNATIHTSNHRVNALSHFDLSFLFNDDLQVKFSLEPNHDILAASGATVSYLGPDGQVVRQETIDRSAHKVYKGTAWLRRDGMQKAGSWLRVGWARVTVRRDGLEPVFEGAFSVNRDAHHIQSVENYERTRHGLDPIVEDRESDLMVLYRDSDIMKKEQLDYQHGELRRSLDMGLAQEPACQADSLMFNNMADHPVYVGMLKRSDRYWGSLSIPSILNKRQIDSTTTGNSAGVNLSSTIGQSAGCPTTRKVALVGVATDCTYTNSFNSTETARENVITQMNTASSLWEKTFNISLGLQNLTISDSICPGTPPSTTPWNQACSDNVTINDRLNLFSAWRGTLQDDNSHWTLLSTCNTGSAVGLAWLGQACVNTAESTNSTGSTTSDGSSSGDTETVSGANVVIRTPGASEWQIIAHETGHTFGAVHDCTSQTCASANTVSSSQCCPLSSTTCDANDQFIMNPSTGSGIQDFSACTVGNICSAIGRNSVKTSCLSDNKGVSTITGQQCGNGIVEEGEECDCGGTEGCGSDACCDPTTCKFTNGAVCDPSNEECCQSCQFSNNGTVCRASTGVCDPAEVCTGSSASCPADTTAPDGQNCGSGLKCASGQCTSRDEQCKSVMGTYTQGNDTYACDSTSCTITCGSPDFGANTCYSVQQNYLDGTGCGGGGNCLNGQCKGSSVGGEVKSWIDSNKALVIGLASAIGALVLFTLFGCILRCCRRRRNPPMKNRGRPPPPPPEGWQGWNGPAPPVPRHEQPMMSGAGGHPMWYGDHPPPTPPPSYIPRSSVRYA